MILRGVDFGNVLCSSGSLGFFGDGYWYHSAFRPLGLDFSGCTFVAKTTTLNARAGNMKMKEDGITPSELVPGCVKVSWAKGAVLNSVGLSGPGAEALFKAGRWQKREKPFFVSFMSVEQAPGRRLEELEEFVHLFRRFLPEFKAKVGLEINFSCPNVGVSHSNLTREVAEAVGLAAKLEVPVVPNLSPDVPVDVGVSLVESGCDAISVSNTVKFGNVPDKIDWKGLWGDESPLKDLGGGGVSGAPLLPLVLDWGRSVLERSLPIPLVLGGGILSAQDVEDVVMAGADAVKLGTVGMLRPWRVRGIVRRAELLYSSQKLSRPVSSGAR
jgi:dihydroorotate dehydrogenase (NAD+) catalytic subunit